MSSAHASSNFGTKYHLADKAGALSIALIGPHQKRRWEVANALSETHRASVREFDSYPPDVEHMERLFAAFEVVVLDGDSDPAIALHMVEAMRSVDGATTMVYSENADRNVAAQFLRGGAREYLLLPLEADAMSDALNRATTMRPKLVPVEENEASSKIATLTPPGRSAAPAVTWPMPAPITYGEKLSAAQLNATASVRGKFVYTPGTGYVLPTGTHTLWVTFTPEESWDDPLQVAVTIVVNKATPELSWPAPPEIAGGEPLGERHLNASSSVSGKFEYSPGAGAVLPPGSHTLSVTFTPADQANYIPAQARRTIAVTRETPAIEWPAPEPIRYGTALSAKQLCASAPVAGTFEYKPSPGAILAAGEHLLSAVFKPEDASSYTEARMAAALTVSKASPAIEWPAPQPITHGNALGAAQLNAVATVPGSFAYTPAAGQVLSPGVHKLTAVFTPADTLNYTSVRSEVTISVAEKMPVDLNWTAPAAISYGTVLSAAQLNATASAPGTLVYAPPEGIVLAPGRYSLSVSFLPADFEKYSAARAAVELEVKGLPDLTSSPAGIPNIVSKPKPAVEHPAPVPAVALPERNQAAKQSPRETRTYRGAVYEKGDDGQWHLQKK